LHAADEEGKKAFVNARPELCGVALSDFTGDMIRKENSGDFFDWMKAML